MIETRGVKDEERPPVVASAAVVTCEAIVPRSGQPTTTIESGSGSGGGSVSDLGGSVTSGGIKHVPLIDAIVEDMVARPVVRIEVCEAARDAWVEVMGVGPVV